MKTSYTLTLLLLLLFLLLPLDTFIPEVDFSNEHRDILNLSVDDLELTDLENVLDGIEDYDTLSSKDQRTYEEELDRLNMFKGVLEDLREEIDNYEVMYDDVLSHTEDTIDLSYEENIEEAIAAYEDLSPNAQDDLQEERDLLDSLLFIITSQKEVSMFKENHQEALSLSTNNVELEDQLEILFALEDYDDLSENGKSLLTNEKILLDNLLDELTILEELDTYIQAHSAELLLTIELVEIADRADIEIAIDAYSTLSEEAQARLENEQNLLENLLAEIVIKEDLQDFRTEYEFELALDVDSVNESNQQSIQDAIAFYDTLSIDVKSRLVNERQLLEDLLTKIYSADEATSYRIAYAIELNLTTNTVGMTHKPIIEEAINTYNQLDDFTKELLVDEKALLDDLMSQISILESVEVQLTEDANNYREIYADELALTVDTVLLTHKASIQIALNAYNSLDENVKQELNIEKNLLENLLLKIEELEATAAEVNTFKVTHAAELTLTTETVQISDKTDVEAALASYNELTAYAKVNLRTEKDLLDSLLMEILLLEGTNAYTTTYSDVLALTTDNVAIEDKTDIEEAIDAYALLSRNSKVELLSEKALLEGLLLEIAEQEEVIAYETSYASELALTTETVQISDKVAIEAAIIAYDNLSAEAQAELSNDKILLDNLLAEIVSQEELAAEVSSYETSYAAELALTTETVQISDKASIEAAITAYNSLSSEAKAALTSEKALLDDLLSEIQAQEDANEFSVTHASALALTEETITSEDRAVVEAAIIAYDNLSIEAQAKLTSEKALLNQLLNVLNAGEEVASEIAEYESTYADELALTEGTVTIEDKAAVEAALTAYGELSLDAQSALVTQENHLNHLLQEIVEQEEILAYETAYASELALTTETVVITDKTDVEAAITAYEALSIEAQARLIDEKDLLDSLLLEITAQEELAIEISTYETNYASELALTIETVVIGDKTNVEAAIAAYETLSSEAQGALINEKVLLDNVLLEILVQEEVLAYETSYANELALTTETVTISDKADVEAAISDYNNLHVDAQARLTDEKALLDSLLLEITAQEELAIEISTYETSYANELALTTETVTISDKVNVEAAIAAYETLSSDAQIRLSDDKALLDSLLAEILVQEEVLAYETTYATELALQIETVNIGDKASIESAIAAYDSLSVDAQARVLADKGLLESLLVEIENQEAIAQEVQDYETIYESTLEFTLETITIGDKANVEAAITAYNNLSTGAQTSLITEKDLLDDLLERIELQEEVLAYETSYATELALTIGTVTIADKADVEAAITAYNSLSSEAQAELATEKALLDNLLAEIVVLEEVLAYETSYAAELALTTETVQISDKADVEAAIIAYEALSTKAQTELIAEKILLDDLLLEIEAQEGTTGEVNTYTTSYATELALTTETVQISDKADVEAAIIAYDNLSSEAQAELATEKALLEGLLLEIAEQEEVIAYETSYASELALTTETVQISDKAAIEAAIIAYDNLSAEAQAELSNDKILLDNLLAEIVSQEELAAEVSSYETSYAAELALTTETVQISDKASIEAAITAYNSLSSEAKAALTSEKALLDDLLSEIQAQEDANEFSVTHASALALTEETITSEDRAVVEAAIIAYDNLSIEAQAKLTSEKALLNQLLNVLNAGEEVASEIAEYESTYADELALTEGTVTIEDKAAVEAALTAYGELSLDAQSALVTQENHLNHLLQEIVEQEEILAYETAYASELALTTETVVITDKTDVEAAITAYEALSIEAQARLIDEKDLLDSLLLEITAQEELAIEISTYETNYASELALTIETVVIGDKTNVEAAIAAYETLSSEAQGALINEKVLLDNVLLEILVQEEVLAYETSYANELALTTETVTISDKADVEAAISDYNNLHVDAQARLTDEKALLDSLLLEITAQEELAIEISTYETSYANELALTTETVTISDKVNVEAAIAAYETLSSDAQIRLSDDKALLDSLLAEILVQEGILQELNAEKDAILAGEQNNLFTDLIISASDTQTKINALNNEIHTIITNANVTQSITYLGGTTFEVILSHSLSDQTVTVTVEATFTVITQDEQDVAQATTLIEDYFSSATVIVANYNENVKIEAFLAQANQVIDGLGVIISIDSVTHQAGNNPSTFIIVLEKNGVQTTTTVDVNYSR